jgi:coenzyme F420-reducing hydrogenase delta subunit
MANRQLTSCVVCSVHPSPPITAVMFSCDMQALKNARSGVYCGPLRLLAVENAERLNAEGIPCDLVTGQESTLVEGAKHVSCTVEMTSLTEPVDVAVIDEIQVRCNPS